MVAAPIMEKGRRFQGGKFLGGRLCFLGSIKGIISGKSGKTTKTTIAFDAEDESEIFRLQDELQMRGIRIREVTQTVRMALRIAFADKGDDELLEIHRTLAEKWKRGG